METKICKDCNIEKDINEYYKMKSWFHNICKKCHNIKQISYLHKKKKNLLASIKQQVCILCNIDKNIKHYKLHNINNGKFYSKKCKECLKINIIIKKRLYNIRNKNNIAEYNKTYRINNKNIIKECLKKYHKKESENLTDMYIKSTICNKNDLKRSYITQELIELKRKQLKLYRHVKQETSKNKNNI